MQLDRSPRLDLERAARRYLADLAGTRDDLRPLYLQPGRAVYLAERSGIILKVYVDGAILQRDWDATHLAREAGLPTAVALGFNSGPPALYAMRRAVGQSLGAAHAAAARDAGRLLARFHRLGARPPFASGPLRWADQIVAWAETDLAFLQRRGIVDSRRIAWLRSYFAAAHPRLSERPVALLHGDLQPDHVIVDARGERVVAFIDFADTQPGDPLFDFAVLSLWDDALVDPLLAGYAGISADAATNELLAFYRLWRHLGAIRWFLDRDYRALAARSIAAVVAASG